MKKLEKGVLAGLVCALSILGSASVARADGAGTNLNGIYELVATSIGPYQNGGWCTDQFHVFSGPEGQGNYDGPLRIVTDSKWFVVEHQTGNGFQSYADAPGIPLGTSIYSCGETENRQCSLDASYSGSREFDARFGVGHIISVTLSSDGKALYYRETGTQSGGDLECTFRSVQR